MEITDIRIRKTNTEGKMRAVVSLTLDNMIAVHDIKIIESKKGLFIAMPCRKTPSGVFKDIVHPINSETREMMQSLILKKYNEMADNPEENAEGDLDDSEG
ncbi:MAG: septation regulator SpoVG [Clostridia bacterium]|jgi:stage V sporulation protein G|nr:septation regulator SpoVG [Clostridiaceae bacterium]